MGDLVYDFGELYSSRLGVTCLELLKGTMSLVAKQRSNLSVDARVSAFNGPLPRLWGVWMGNNRLAIAKRTYGFTCFAERKECNVEDLQLSELNQLRSADQF